MTNRPQPHDVELSVGLPLDIYGGPTHDTHEGAQEPRSDDRAAVCRVQTSVDIGTGTDTSHGGVKPFLVGLVLGTAHGALAEVAPLGEVLQSSVDGAIATDDFKAPTDDDRGAFRKH